MKSYFINEEKWHGYSLNEQLGNILSEVARAHNRQKVSDLEGKKKALERALELIDLTLIDKKHTCSLKEIKILRDMVVDKYVDGNNFNVTFEEIEDYLLPFAILARK